MADSLIEKFYRRLEMRRNHLNDANSLNTTEKLVWGEAMEWCYDTLVALEAAEESQEVEVPEMPDELGCDTCDD